jgi:hypothetical protein
LDQNLPFLNEHLVVLNRVAFYCAVSYLGTADAGVFKTVNERRQK